MNLYPNDGENFRVISNFSSHRTLSKLVQKVVTITINVSKLILDVYNSDSFDIEIKSDNSPVTKADKIASKYIHDELKLLNPNIPIICEEGTHLSYSKRMLMPIFWLVDPVDGTKEFINRNGEFTVNIALIYRDHPVLGVVGVPTQNIFYYGSKDSGSYKFDNNDHRTVKLECKEFNISDDLNIVVSKSHNNPLNEMFCNEMFHIKKKLDVGSSLKFMMLCENKAHVYPRLIPCYEWDTGASDIILRESGGSIRVINKDQTIGDILQYNKQSLLNPYFLAYGKCPDIDVAMDLYSDTDSLSSF